MVKALLVILSILTVFILGFLIYQRDKNKEPLDILLILAAAGIGAAVITLFLNYILSFIPFFHDGHNNLGSVELFIYVFIGIGLVEEFSKWILIFGIGYDNEEFDELFDMIVYSTFVSLGFACLENILYNISSTTSVMLLRMVLALPGHACFAVFMGYYLGLSKRERVKGNTSTSLIYMGLSIIIPTIIHGFYDFCLLSDSNIFTALFAVFIIVLYYLTIKKVITVSKENQQIYNYDWKR